MPKGCNVESAELPTGPPRQDLAMASATLGAGPEARDDRRPARPPGGDVAQLAERRVRIAEARGSSPLISTNYPLTGFAP